MGELIVLIIILVVWGISKADTNRKLDNYDMNKVSIGKMSMDSGKSYSEIRRNLVNGKYDKDEHWKNIENGLYFKLKFDTIICGA